MVLNEDNTKMHPADMGSPNQFCLRWNNHRNTLLGSLSQLFGINAFSDVTIACAGGVPLKAHRIILSACSPFFESLLLDTPSNATPILILKDVHECDMRALLTYMYCGEVNVDHDDLGNLLKIADVLKIRGLATNDQSSNIENNSENDDTPQAQNLTQKPRPESTPPPIPTDLRTQTIPTTSSSEVTPPNNYSDIPTRRLDMRPISPPKYKPSLPQYIDTHHADTSPTSHYPTPPHSSRPYSSRPEQQRLDVKESPLSVIRESRELPVHRTESPQILPEDLRDHRRPLSIIPPSPHSHLLNGPESPAYKRKRVESILSPNPILQNALGPQPNPFSHDIPSLMQSMLPIPGFFGGMPRFLSEARDHPEPYFGGLSIKKDLTLPDEDSRPFSDASRDDESDKVQNGNIYPEYQFPLDQNGPNHFNNFVNYNPHPKPEWKRYKQYTKSDLTAAIEAVKSGTTALQASRKYKVPSRTLYDKIKKLGINNILRKLPSKKVSSTDIDTNKEQIIEPKPEYPPSSVHDIIHPRIKQEEEEPIPGTSPPDHQEELTRRGSFSVVPQKLFEDHSSVPLDLTEAESISHSRTEIEDRA